LRSGFPHSGICGSKLVCQLPAAYRKLLRPSSPVIAKASTTCTYSLDPIALRTPELESPGQAKRYSPHLSSLGTLLRIWLTQSQQKCPSLLESSSSPERSSRPEHLSTSSRLLKSTSLEERIENSPRHGSGLRVTPRGKVTNSQQYRKGLVEVNGIEPMTPCLQSRCSPS
jgi:hypothetical protein